MTKLALHWQILIAIVLAVVAGSLTGTTVGIGDASFYQVYGFIGSLFLNALKMIVVPLIVASIISSVANLGDNNRFAQLGGKTLAFYVCSSLLAVMVGLCCVNLIQPGQVDPQVSEKLIASVDAEKLDILKNKVEDKGGKDIVDVFLRMVPPNVINAATDNRQMLAVIFFSLLFGFFMTRITTIYKESLQHFWQGVFETMMGITLFIMKFAPIGVFALVAKTVAETGFDAFGPMLTFFFTVALALFIHAVVVMPIILKFVAGVSPVKHYQAMAPALLTAFSSASSSATLPLTMDCVENRAGVSKNTSNFVLPLGATVNMDGTALYECVAAIFIAQVYGIELSFVTQFTIVVVALLTSIGVAGIPSASLVAISVILGVIGVPLEGIGLLMLTDRVLDMLRTSVNVFGDSCAAVVIDKLEPKS